MISCASTKPAVNEQHLKYSYLPPKLNIDSLMPVNSVVDTNLHDFTSVAIDSGKLVTINKDTLKLHPGVLISEKKAALFIYYKSSYEYLYKKAMLTNILYSDYYDKSVDAEKIYQNDIINLSKKAERTWLEKNMVYFGFIAGIATCILTEYAVIKTSK
jgi:Pyruvate/2-oxoacid:ferredoxin oxidoreductase gamma subunit